MILCNLTFIFSVIIQSGSEVPPLNDDTILFLEGHKVLGQVYCGFYGQQLYILVHIVVPKISVNCILIHDNF